MRRYSFSLMMATVSALTIGLMLTGCGKKKDDDDEELPKKKSAKKSDGGGSKAALRKAVAAPKGYGGVIRGKITWEGDPPDLKEMTDKLRAAMTTNREYCLMGKEYETTEQAYRIGDNKGLGNVFVWIEPEADHYFKVPENQLSKFKDTKVVLSQPHCAFLPHCAVLFPSHYEDGKQVASGQKLEIQNDASVSHNSNIGGGLKNPPYNRTLAPKDHMDYPPGGEKETVKIESTPLTVSCNIHGWMKAYLRAFDHPYSAVSSTGGDVAKKQYEDPKSEKFGTYEITGVPVGAKVRLIAWHEALTFLGDGAKGRELVVKEGNNDVDFTAKK